MQIINPNMINKTTYRLYGRTKGRKKKYNNSFLKLKLKTIDKKKDYIIDIGVGFGESTIKLAKENKDKIVICCEKYIDGLNSLYNKAQNESLDNIQIYPGNAHQLLDEYCEENSIFELWILFPDPWPKKRHFKRRLINIDFFNKLKNFLKKDAKIHIASDSKSYIAEILMIINQIKKEYKWVNQNKREWDYLNLTLPKTKYFQKALKKGLNPIYLKLIKY